MNNFKSQYIEFMKNYHINLEAGFIIICGLILHMCRISVIEMNYTSFKPNFSSVLVTFSMLCLLAKIRPFWPSKLRQPPLILQILAENLIILYATDFTIRHIWAQYIQLIKFLCLRASQSFFTSKRRNSLSMQVSKWIEEELHVILGCVMALLILLFMIDSVGVQEYLPEPYKQNWFAKRVLSDWPIRTKNQRHLNRTGKYKCISRSGMSHLRFRNFNPTDLPLVPPQDLLSVGNFLTLRRQGLSKVQRQRVLYDNTALGDSNNTDLCTCPDSDSG